MSIIGKKILSVLNTSVKEKTKRGALISFDSAATIGILYTWENLKKEALISTFISQIDEKRTVECLCFNPDKNVMPDTVRPIFNISELSILGNFNSPNADKFLSVPYDYLFHLDFELNEITEALLIKSKASCRIGLHSENSANPYELMIGINENAGLDNLIEQMLKYVNALK